MHTEYESALLTSLHGLTTDTLQDLRCGLITEQYICVGAWMHAGKSYNSECLFGAAVMQRKKKWYSKLINMMDKVTFSRELASDASNTYGSKNMRKVNCFHCGGSGWFSEETNQPLKRKPRRINYERHSSCIECDGVGKIEKDWMEETISAFDTWGGQKGNCRVVNRTIFVDKEFSSSEYYRPGEVVEKPMTLTELNDKARGWLITEIEGILHGRKSKLRKNCERVLEVAGCKVELKGHSSSGQQNSTAGTPAK